MKKKAIYICIALLFCFSSSGYTSNSGLTGIPIIGSIITYFKEEPDHYSLTYNQQDQSNNAIAWVSARDENDKELWCFGSEPYVLTELCDPVDMGAHDGLYYFCAGTTIYALNYKTGECVWECSDFGGYVSAYAFDQDGNLCAAGCYGPFLAIIDKEGNMLHRYEEGIDSAGNVQTDWINPYYIFVFNDKIHITYSDGSSIYVNPETGVGTAVETSTSYTDEQYITMAKDYYEKINSQRPPKASIKHDGDGNVTIHLYETVNDDGKSHDSTWDWYTVDEKTLEGTNLVGDSICLK